MTNDFGYHFMSLVTISILSRLRYIVQILRPSLKLGYWAIFIKLEVFFMYSGNKSSVRYYVNLTNYEVTVTLRCFHKDR